MTDAPKPTLTEAEREELERSLRWHFAAHAEQPYPGYAGLGVENALNIVTHIVEAREAAARREALLEAADVLPNMTEGDRREGTRRWPLPQRDAYSLAVEEAQGALRALAEPERDEEGR